MNITHSAVFATGLRSKVKGERLRGWDAGKLECIADIGHRGKE
jgi:hypothetical protein